MTVLHQLGHPEKRKAVADFDEHERYNVKVDALTHAIPDVGAPLATRVLCAGRGVWCSYRPKFEIGVVELLARKRKLAIAPGTTGTRPLGGRIEMPEFGDPSKSRTSRFRAVNTPLGYFGLYGDEDEHAQTF